MIRFVRCIDLGLSFCPVGDGFLPTPGAASTYALRNMGAGRASRILRTATSASALPEYKPWHDAWLGVVAGAHLGSVGRTSGPRAA